MSAKKPRIGNNPLDWIKPTLEENDKSHTEIVEQKTSAAVPASDVAAKPTVLAEAPESYAAKKEAISLEHEGVKSAGRPYYFIPISAKSKESLYQKYRDLSEWLQKESGSHSFDDIAYTLLIGRSHFFVRSALIVTDAAQLKSKLKEVLETGKAEGFFARNPDERASKPDAALKEQGNGLLQVLGDGKAKEPESYLRTLTSIADLYVKGYDLNWGSLYPGGNYRRIYMPTYPFAMNRYWANSAQDTGTGGYTAGAIREELHPLVGVNSSTLEEQCFTKIFSGDESYLKDHVVGKDKILPGVAYLEMARAAGKLANPDAEVAALRDISWQNPIRLTDKDTSFTAKISLFPCGDTVEFEVSSKGTNSQKVVHGTGRIDFRKQDGQSKDQGVTNIVEIRARCTKKVAGAECYRVFAEKGLNLGPGFQAVKELYCGKKEVLSVIELPGHLESEFSLYGLYPSLMDGALETVIGLLDTEEMESKALALPFEMGSVEIYGNVPKRVYSHARELEDASAEKNVRHYDVDILDESGNTLVRMKGFGIRPFFQFERPVNTGLKEKLHYHVAWEENGTYENRADGDSESKTNLLVFSINGMDTGLVEACYEKAAGRPCQAALVMPGNTYKSVDSRKYEIDPSNPEDYRRLLEELSAGGALPTDIIHIWSYGKGSTDEQLTMGYHAVFNLSRALAEYKPQDKLRLIYAHPVNGREALPVHAAMGGFARTARIENSKWVYKVLGIQSALGVEDTLETAFKELSPDYDEDVEVIAEAGKRLVKRLKPFSIDDLTSKEVFFEEGGVYLITGGIGGLGLIFAKYISQRVKGARVVLSGRSQPGDKRLELLQALEGNRAEIVYIQSDVADRASVEALASDIRQRFGRLDGILHSAGVIRDAYIYKKTQEEIKEVLAPKIYGTLNLDEVFKNENLKFFVFFSSIAALTGNAGQCDYSYANSFMDYYALYREGLARQGERKGKALSVNWSLWQEGGMRVEDSTRTLFADTMGIKPLRTEIGLDALEKGLSSNLNQFLVVEGEKKKLDLILDRAVKEKKVQTRTGIDPEELLKKIQASLMGIVGNILKIQENDIHFDREMSEFGFNSLSFTDFSNEVNKRYGISTTPAIFFEHPTLRSFSQHLSDEYRDTFIEYYYSDKGIQTKTAEEAQAVEDPPANEERASRLRFRDNGSGPVHGYDRTVRPNEPIAIIGMGGVMPLSEDLDEFWKNIEAERDLVSEVPKDRWDWEEVDRQANMQVSRWGGFMKEVDKFDAMFFGISPREADLMDPQQRILLETVWKTIEDAGYKPSDLSGSKTGLFVGVTTMDYVDVEKENNIQIEAYTTTGASHCILANRVSFLLNLHGPSVPLDTACSSSLIAIHQAVESIRNGDSEMAIAGGVSALLSSPVFVSFTKAGMLSPDGKCKTFDKSANGYVRGEGCGTILLKPLSKALADRDHIHAVIKGSAVNHGGRANSLTAPNPNAQAQLLVKAYERAEISPDTISYIEAHGTGTNLGDPVEINGLKIAFKELYKKNNLKQTRENYCGLCSVKTNIGHLEAAAGIAGILKILLSMKYKKIPGNVHLKEVNPYIDVKGSPFYIVKETKEWECLKNDNGLDMPRRAGVSSFGFGGANSHIVLEEYNQSGHRNEAKENQPVLVVLSAKNVDRLRESARKLKEFLEEDDPVKRELHLTDIAYTLQVGREAMEERLAIVAGSREEIITNLSHYLHNKDNVKMLFYGSTEQGGKPPVLDMDGDDREYLDTLIRKHKLEKIARLWVEGAKIDWELLYQGAKPFRVPLPTYPFARVRHWVSGENYNNSQSSQYNYQRALHPMIDSNESTLEEEKFKKTLRVQEFYLKDHVVAGQILLPGVAYLEIARAAGELAGQKKVSSLKDVIWVAPVSVGKEGKDIHIGLYPGKETVEYEVYSLGDGQRKVHSQGTLSFGPQLRAPRKYNISEIKSRCTGRKGKEECYQKVFKAVGFDYGPTFQVTQDAFIGDREGLARLELPQSAGEGFENFVLHPSIMDGAVRAVTWIGGSPAGQDTSLRVPFALGELEIFRAPTPICYAYASPSGESGENGITRYEIVLLDEQGEELVSMKDFAVREYKNTELAPSVRSEDKLLYYTPSWEAASRERKGSVGQKESGGHLIVFESLAENGATGKYSAALDPAYEKVVTVVKGKEFSKLNDTCYSVNPASRKDYTRLWEELTLAGIKPLRIIHLWNVDSQKGDGYENIHASVLQEHLKTGMEEGIYSLLYLFQEVSAAKLDRKVKCIFAFNGSEDSNPQFAAVYGLARTIASSNGRFELATTEICGGTDDGLMEAVNAELYTQGSINGMEIRISEGKRFVRKMKLAGNTKSISVPLKKQGVYLITGGNGALGMILAQYLAQKYSARLVLTGRRPQDESLVEKLNKLKAYGAEAIYHQGDMAVLEEVESAVKAAREAFGKLDGVFHCAGIGDSTSIFKATAQSFEKALVPKVYGAVNLDRATSDENLDLFVMFSSITGETGDLGSGSYAAANCFMDRFSKMRENLRAQNRRKGRTVSINWPFWADGGFEFPRELLEYYTESSGLREINSEIGLKTFEELLGMEDSQVVVAYGDPIKITRLFSTYGEPEAGISYPAEPEAGTAAAEGDGTLRAGMQKYLKEMFAKTTKIPVGQIGSKAEFEKFGIDSILIMELNKQLEKDFGALPRTLFFEYNNLEDLAGYFVKTHPEKIRSMLGGEEQAYTRERKEIRLQASGAGTGRTVVEPPVALRTRFTSSYREAPDSFGRQETREDDIAIIGISGRYPGADNLEEFWENLKIGKDCITEIPPDRWDYTGEFDPQRGKEGKYYCKYGGFLKDVDKFDAPFFNMSPRDAMGSDPQERLFLETVQHTIEDAGYRRSDFSKAKVGVYVGVMYGQYNLFGVEETLKGNPMALNSLYASIANRVSYFFNLTGPSVALDSMCSSSLTALHLACESLHKGESDMAIAGGINLTIHPDKYRFLCSVGFISSDGKCRSFGEGGDGYVPGEGVGAVLLKPLSKARKDKDHIYAIVKATAINHNGRTNGYSVPSPNAQTGLMAETFAKSGINPRTLSYIEGHGTGTSLGDAIEIVALSKVFGEYTDDRQFCPIGSVKSNVGHLESAAGMAALAKVLLQMKNRQLVPSIHSEIINGNINFKDSPFYIQHELSEWKRPVTDEDGVKKNHPRRAAISSFGAGGSNAHVIIEEFEGIKKEKPVKRATKKVFVLSAKSREGLHAYAENFLAFLEKQPLKDDGSWELLREKVEKDITGIISGILKVDSTEINTSEEFEEYGLDWIGLSSLAEAVNQKYGLSLPPALPGVKTIKDFVQSMLEMQYDTLEAYYNSVPGVEELDETAQEGIDLEDVIFTMQVGREALEERLAVVASSLEELKDTLALYCRSEEGIKNLYTGSTRRKKSDGGILPGVEDMEEYTKNSMLSGDMEQIAKLWVSGHEVDWELLYTASHPRRVPLPVYPFQRERYWAPDHKTETYRQSAASRLPATGIHPLIDANESTFDEQCFRKDLLPKDIFFDGITVLGRKMLPVLAFVEMARAAGNLSNRHKSVMTVSDVKWSKPDLEITEGSGLYISLYPENGSADYEICLKREGMPSPIILNQGCLEYGTDFEAAVQGAGLDMEGIKASCSHRIDPMECYNILEKRGLQYSKVFRPVKELRGNGSEALALLEIDESTGYRKDMLLHPALLEGMVQAALCFLYDTDQYESTYVPYSLKELKIMKPLPGMCHAYIRKTGSWKENCFDIKFLDTNGNLLVDIREFKMKELRNPAVGLKYEKAKDFAEA